MTEVYEYSPSGMRARRPSVDGASQHSDQDVCYPHDDNKEGFEIDFTALDDFNGEDDVPCGVANADMGSRVVRVAPQDHFAFFSTECEETIRANEFSEIFKDGCKAKELFDAHKGTWWLDCYDPTDAEMKLLAKAFGIHPLTVEDIQHREAREKVEMFRNYYFVAFHAYEQDVESDDFMEMVPFYLCVFPEGVISFHYSPVPHCATVRKRIRQLKDHVTVTPDWICYAVIDDITDSFAPVIREIEQEGEIVEQTVFDARDDGFNEMLRRIGKARAKTLSMMRLLSGKADVVGMFTKRVSEGLSDHVPKGHISLYLGDIQDHIVTMYQSLIAHEKILSRSHLNYLSQLQVQSIDATHRVTDTLGKITVIGTILIPMNFVTGLFAMNVRIPGESTDENPGNFGWFFGILGVLLCIIVTATLVAKWYLAHVEKKIRGNFRNSASDNSIRSMRSKRSKHTINTIV
ncbi:hypothetical protein B0I72DRAFT_139925 [Yarrowia lipolytica]|jgi:magnesium transporter|uniref:YALI0E00462p n=2 Tax=Yarrowia lipolytica TaxID=4952 RepID=Q6C7J0_YARLI|nr:YALI0E00462p [Yarrowia lipolytica CLIB122]AOW04761.1 hypothetical protein YALI1_E00824g [Yarrowia lipolytica]KAB8282814.1 hypothetical protein BKA91DRAFT_137749 [Yarrowia lipolytica]KAE8174537.1 hypothetical protein BKA90DRAFT_133592 [Yarrowia lipolytica]KAJ8056344.1 hypothetical protein LXG23DRAFT_16139 [Yarrowia lipolytica]QNP98695.1 Putative metal ion transporter [Yarrowia lipolytica]|eukprot:XP_503372.1 YALI0E00462p [Yarrowia lipolytica CLIB122]